MLKLKVLTFPLFIMKTEFKILYFEKIKIFNVLAFPLHILKTFKNVCVLAFCFLLYLKKFRKDFLCTYFLLFLILSKIQKTFIIRKKLFVKTTISNLSIHFIK